MITKTYLKPKYLPTYLCDSSDGSDINDSSDSSERSDGSDQNSIFPPKINTFFIQKKNQLKLEKNKNY